MRSQDINARLAIDVDVTGNGTKVGRGYDYVTIKYNNNGDQQWRILCVNQPSTAHKESVRGGGGKRKIM